MDTLESMALLNRQATYSPTPGTRSGDGLTFNVTITDTRERFGRTDVLIEPVPANGTSRWVALDSVILPRVDVDTDPDPYGYRYSAASDHATTRAIMDAMDAGAERTAVAAAFAERVAERARAEGRGEDERDAEWPPDHDVRPSATQRPYDGYGKRGTAQDIWPTAITAGGVDS